MVEPQYHILIYSLIIWTATNYSHSWKLVLLIPHITKIKVNSRFQYNRKLKFFFFYCKYCATLDIFWHLDRVACTSHKHKLLVSSDFLNLIVRKVIKFGKWNNLVCFLVKLDCRFGCSLAAYTYDEVFLWWACLYDQNVLSDLNVVLMSKSLQTLWIHLLNAMHGML